MKIYFGNVAWGWRMFGVGYKSKWFLGFSMQHNGAENITPLELIEKIKSGEKFTVDGVAK